MHVHRYVVLILEYSMSAYFILSLDFLKPLSSERHSSQQERSAARQQKRYFFEENTSQATRVKHDECDCNANVIEREEKIRPRKPIDFNSSNNPKLAYFG